MRKLGIWIALPSAVICFTACKPKEKPATTEAPASASEANSGTTAPSPAATTPQTPAISSAERAAKLGFARHLPADTQCVISVHNTAQAVKRIKASQLWNVVSEVSNSPAMRGGELLDDIEGDIDSEQDSDAPAEEEVEPAAGNPTKLLEREITLAFGNGTAKQSENLLTLNRRFTYHQMKSLASLFAQAVEDDDAGRLNPSAIVSEEFAKNILKDDQAGVALFSLMNMPPIYAAFLSTPDTKESDSREIINSLEMIGMMGEGMVTDVEVSTAGTTFTGKKILGAKVAESLANVSTEGAAFMGKETFDQLVAEITKKNLVILTGSIGDYFVFFLGSSEDECRLASSPEESLAGGNSLAFTDPYITKDLLAVIHGSKDLVSSLVSAAGGLKDMADGLRDGISGTTSLGNTRDIESLLQLVADKESELKKLQVVDSTSSLFYFEDGLKGESFGGLDYGAIDWTTDNLMGDIANTEGVFLFANLSTPAPFDKAAAEYYEAILQSCYTIALKVAEKSGENPDLAQFTQSIQLFDSKFRVELINMWKAFSIDMEDGLGRERAWVIDLKGTVPPIPGIPQPVIDKAKFPRMSVIAPVSDRSKLVSSWNTINESTTRILAQISEITDNPIPMQKPISSDKDGLTTWFFSMPFFNDDFMPSVTVGEQWFATSTSKMQAVDLIKQAAASKSKTKGLFFKIDFKALQSFLKETIPVVVENAEALDMTENDLISLKRMPEAVGELDSLEINCRKENGLVRTSLHFKTR
jgi:hypothetical protein